MKKSYFTAVMLLIVVIMPTWAEAALINHSNGEILLDDTTGLVWYRPVSSFKDQSYLEQLESISLLNRDYDVNEDGLIDKLTWHMADISMINDLIENYQLTDDYKRNDFMDHFWKTYSYWPDNLYWYTRIKGYIKNGTEDSYGKFSLSQRYFSGPNYQPIGYEYDAYDGSTVIEEFYGFIPESEGSEGPIFIIPPIAGTPNSYPIDYTGAWVSATVLYATPIPSTIVLLSLGLLGIVRIRR